MPEPKILLLDIETAPNLVFTWGVHEQEVIEVVRPWFIFSFAWQWLGEKKVHVRALPDYAGYHKDPHNDLLLVSDLWKLLDQADFVVAHNGQRFDVRKIRTRWLVHGFQPPSPFETMDTLTWGRRYFGFNSNKLDALGGELNVGRKLAHTGKKLWLGCYNRDMPSWAKMKAYNKHDVELLHNVYLKFRAWVKHPRLDYYTEADSCCPACQSEKFILKGFSYLKTGRRQRAKCLDCGHKFTVGGIIKDAA